MSEMFSRTELLLGGESIKKLANATVAVFGVGGVGGYVCEALVRSGVGHFHIIDNDTVCESNINRQIIATTKTLGRSKVDVMKERMLEINPDVDVTVHECFFLPETADTFDFSKYDYVVDAVDTVTAKIELVMKCNETGTPIMSSMGAGNKLNPAAFKVADIYKTSVCPLAKVMRHELKKRGIRKLKVVYSEEIPMTPNCNSKEATDTALASSTGSKRRSTPGSVAFVPSVAGLIIAGEVIKDLLKQGDKTGNIY